MFALLTTFKKLLVKVASLNGSLLTISSFSSNVLAVEYSVEAMLYNVTDCCALSVYKNDSLKKEYIHVVIIVDGFDGGGDGVGGAGGCDGISKSLVIRFAKFCS